MYLNLSIPCHGSVRNVIVHCNIINSSFYRIDCGENTHYKANLLNTKLYSKKKKIVNGKCYDLMDHK